MAMGIVDMIRYSPSMILGRLVDGAGQRTGVWWARGRSWVL